MKIMKFIYAAFALMGVSSMIKNITPKRHKNRWTELKEKNENNIRFLPIDAQTIMNKLFYIIYFIQMCLVFVSAPTFVKAGLVFIPGLVICDCIYVILRYAFIAGSNLTESCANPPSYIFGMFDNLVWLMWGVGGLVL